MNKIIIKLDVKDKRYFVSNYNDDVVNPKLVEYLYNYLVGKDIKKKVIVKIQDNFNINDSDRSKYIFLIKEEIKENIGELSDELYSNGKRSVIFLFIGCLIITLSYLFSYLNLRVISEIIVIFGWVIIWEVAYYAIFSNYSEKKKIKRYKQLYNADIKFIGGEHV